MTQKLLLNLSDVARYLGMSRPTTYKIVRSVGFPKPVAVGLDKQGRPMPPHWSVDSIDAWRAAHE